MAFIEGGENHRIHSGSKGGRLSTNEGPLMDLIMLSESPVRCIREGVGGGGGLTLFECLMPDGCIF